MHGNVRLSCAVKVVDKYAVESNNPKETDMKPTIKAGLVTAFTGLSAMAMLSPAYAAGFAELDANSDGQLDMTELQAAFDVHAEATLEAYDSDGDGMVSVAEAEAMAAGSATTAAGAADNAADAAKQGAAQAADKAAGGLEKAGEMASDAAETGMSTATEATDGAAEAVGNAMPDTTAPEMGVEADASVEAGAEVTN